MTPSSRPLIGLTAYREDARWGVWSTRADVLPAVYGDAVASAGAVAVLLPVAADDPDGSAREVVARLDGLVVSGGADVSPAAYGAEPHPRTLAWREDRDRWELALLAAADDRGLPVLGICRGMQLMAVGSGGRLDQHLPDVVGHTDHNPSPGEFGSVQVDMAPDSRLRSLVGDRLSVHCHHHQAVLDHPTFTAVARAEDGTLEAMERPGERFCLAVQWHPEMSADAGLFAGLVAAAREHRASGAGART